MNFKTKSKIILKTGFSEFYGNHYRLGWSKSYEIFIGIGLQQPFFYCIKLNQIFLHCVIIGLSWGFDCSLFQVIFFDTYT